MGRAAKNSDMRLFAVPNNCCPGPLLLHKTIEHCPTNVLTPVPPASRHSSCALHAATRCTPIMTMNRLRTEPPRRVESVSNSVPERAWSPRRMFLAIRFALAILVWAAPSPTTGTLFLLASFVALMVKELPPSARRWRRPRRQESVPPIPTAAVDAYFTITERGAPCFAGG